MQIKLQEFTPLIASACKKRRLLPFLLALALLLGVVQLAIAAPVMMTQTAVTSSSTQQATTNACTTNVPEAAGYKLVYQLAIPVDSNYNNSLVSYTVDNAAGIGSYSRVAYCLEVDGQWVWVSMDDFTEGVIAHAGVPVKSANPKGFQQFVSNLNVHSNVSGVVTGDGIETGNIEFWYNCYDPPAQQGIAGSNTLFDFDDTKLTTGSCDGYGSMQVHNYGAKQTVWAFNAWDETDAGNNDIGIGNSTGPHPDWTFAHNAATYTTRTLWIYAAQEIITTVAGNGTRGFSGDGGPATSASLAYPNGMAVDEVGNLYIVDTSNHRIRKITVDGTITTVAGNGSRGFSGDGGPATSASLAYPSGMAVDGTGNLYIGDTDNHRVRKVTTNGIISTVAGNGIYGFSGDGGPATNASLYYPSGMAVDGDGNLYFAERSNNRIRKVAVNGTISTVAGNGTAAFSGDGGAATSAGLNYPRDVAVDAEGTLYIADQNNHRIRKVDSDGVISTVAGNGTQTFNGDGGAATSAGLSFPSGVAVDGAGNLYIASRDHNRVRKVSINGIISTVAGNGTDGFSGDGGPAILAALSDPSGVAVDGAGSLFIADSGNSRVRALRAPANKSDGSPTARNDYTETDEDQAALVRVLDNDSGSGPLTLDKIVNGPIHGSATLEGTTIRYVPNANWNGVDRFDYVVRNAQNQQSTATVQVSVAAVNDPPSSTGLSNIFIDARLGLETPIGTFSTQDVDVGDTHTYRLSGSDAAYFAVAGNVLRRAAFYDPAKRERYLIHVTSTDRAGAQDEGDFALIVVAESPGGLSDLRLSNKSVRENLPANTLVGTLSATDEENQPLSFSLVNGPGDSNNGLFQIVGNQLQTKAALDFETLQVASIRVQVSNGGDAPLQQAMFIQLLDDPTDPPPALSNCTGGDISFIQSNDGQTEVTIRNVQVSQRTDQGCVINGKMFVRIPGNSTASEIDFQGRVDKENDLQSNDELVGDAIDDFTLDPAGPTLKLSDVIIEYYAGRPSLRIPSPSICLPEALGGLCSGLSGFTLLIDSSGLNFGGTSDEGDEAVQNLLAGLSFSKKGFGIADISGKYQRVANGYEISAAGTFSIPRLSSGKAGCGIAVALTIGKDSTGLLTIQIQPIAAAPNSPTAAEGVRLSELSLGLSCDPGIPIAQSGLYLTEVAGTVSLRPDDTFVQLSLTVVTLKKIDDIALAQAEGSAKVLIAPEWGLDLGVQLELLSAIEVAKADASIRKDRFSARFSFQALVIGGEAGVDIWTADTHLHFTGRGNVGVKAAKGSIYEKCVSYFIGRACLSLPPTDIRVGGIGADFGEFTNGKYGFKGYVSVLSKEYGFYVDHKGKLAFGGVSEYMLATPPALLAMAVQAAQVEGLLMVDSTHADNHYTFLSEREVIIQVPDRAVAIAASTGISVVNVAETTDLLFNLSAEPGLSMSLLAPNGLEITPDNYNQQPAAAAYTVHYGSQVVEGVPQERIFTQFSVDNANPGAWRVKLNGNLESNRYLLAVNGLAKPTALTDVTVNAANLQQTQLNWTLTSDYMPVKVTAYLSPEPINLTLTYTDELTGQPVNQVEPNYTGFAVGEFTLSSAAEVRSAATIRTLDLSMVPSGEYHLWLRADNDELPPASAFANAVGTGQVAVIKIDQSTTFPTGWNAVITPTLNVNTNGLELSWQPLTHPDIDYYHAYLGVKSQEYREVSPAVVVSVPRDEDFNPVGQAFGRTSFSAMQPNQSYFLIIEAVDEESGRTVRSQEVTVAFSAGDYQLTTPQQRYQISPGSTQSVPLSLQVVAPLFFENVALGLDSSDLPAGILVTFEDAPEGPPTLNPAQPSRNLIIDVAATVPEGSYTFTVNGYNADTLTRSHTITVVTGQGNNDVFLPLISR